MSAWERSLRKYNVNNSHGRKEQKKVKKKFNAKYFTNKVARNAKDNLYKIPSEGVYQEEEEGDEED